MHRRSYTVFIVGNEIAGQVISSFQCEHRCDNRVDLYQNVITLVRAERDCATGVIGEKLPSTWSGLRHDYRLLALLIVWKVEEWQLKNFDQRKRLLRT